MSDISTPLLSKPYSAILLKERKDPFSVEVSFHSEEVEFTTKIINFKILYTDIIGCDIITDYTLNGKAKSHNENTMKEKSTKMVIFKVDFIGKFTLTESSFMCCKSTKEKRIYKNAEILCTKDEAVNYYNHIVKNTSHQVKLEKADNELGFKIIRKKLLIFINPFGGKGKAVKIWNSVKSMFDISFFEYEVLYTEYRNHAYDYVLKLENNKYYGIICCSGDGIIHEVINALMHRNTKESDNKLDIVIGAIPAGSSNGLVKSNNHEAGESDSDPITSAYLILTSKIRKLDIWELEFQSKLDKVYCFLSMNMAIIADIDLGSEM